MNKAKKLLLEKSCAHIHHNPNHKTIDFEN